MERIKDFFRNRWCEIRYTYHRFKERCSIIKSFIKLSKNLYDFDYSSILEVERFQIQRVRDNIIKYQNHLNWEHDIRMMNIAINLLNIILEEDTSYERVLGDIIFKEIKGTNLYEMDSDCIYKSTKYINTKNASRFVSYDINSAQNEDSLAIFKDTLRIAKAWQLYYKIREQYTRAWWD